MTNKNRLLLVLVHSILYSHIILLLLLIYPSNANITPRTRFVQIYETQYLDEQTEQWQPLFENDVKSDVIPDDFLSRANPPPGFEWSGDWKIDVQRDKREQYGWEYFLDSTNGSRISSKRRKRRWLRSIQPIIPESIPGKEKEVVVSSADKQAIKTSTRDWINLFREQYNWKGFGFGFYKSLLWKYGAGIVLKIPVALNFDFIERRPYLPNLSCGVGVYTCPWTLAGFFDFSFRVELIRFLLVRLMQELLFAFAGLLRLMLLIRKSDQFSMDRIKLKYNNAVSERVGFSISWRIKQGRTGAEFRVSPWVSYYSLLPTISKLLLGTETPVLVKNNEALTTITRWLDQRTAAVGMSSARLPAQYSPQFTLSTYFNLNGFYYTPAFLYVRTYWRNLITRPSINSLEQESLEAVNTSSVYKKETIEPSSLSCIESNTTTPVVALKS